MKIISLVPSITETLFELGLDSEIVGITRYCVRPAEKVKDRLKVGGTKDPDLQGIVKLKPDVVIVNIDENRKEDADYFEQQGIRLLVTFPNTIQESLAMIEEFGREFSVEPKAGELCGQIRARMDFHPPARKTSLALVWRSPYMTAAKETYVHHICKFFGFDLVAPLHDTVRYPELSDQSIAHLDPEVVLFPDEPYPFKPTHLEEFRKKFPDSKAVKQNKLALFNGQHLTWFGYGTLRALREFPELAEENKLWM
jgi:ABC-type Fe3+-hydroxamate transport system substrate-binding protein